jgi:hypothetical protein
VSAGVALLAIAVWTRLQTVDSLILPIELRSGAVASESFTAGACRSCGIQLRTVEPPTSNKLACLLGASVPVSRSCAPLSPVRLKWELYSSGRLVAQDVSPSSNRDLNQWDSPRRWMGVVSVRPGKRYLLRAIALSDAPELSRLDPRIVVTKSGLEIERGVVIMQASILSGGAFLLIGVSWIMVAYIGSSLHRSRRPI